MTSNWVWGASYALLAIFTAGIFYFLAWRLSTRVVSPESRHPRLQFALYWYMVATVTLLGGLLAAASLSRTIPLPIVETAYELQLLMGCLATWGAVSFFVYLRTGRSFLLPISASYIAVLALLLYVFNASSPFTVVSSYGVVTIAPVVPTSSSHLLGPLILVTLSIPVMAGAAAYFTLFFRTHDPTVRFRVAIVSWTLIAWIMVRVFSSAGLLAASPLIRAPVSSFAGQFVGAVAAVLILLAYYPPLGLQRGMRVRPVTERPFVTGASLGTLSVSSERH